MEEEYCPFLMLVNDNWDSSKYPELKNHYKSDKIISVRANKKTLDLLSLDPNVIKIEESRICENSYYE